MYAFLAGSRDKATAGSPTPAPRQLPPELPPAPPQLQPGQTIPAYGLSLIVYLLEHEQHGFIPYGLMDNEQLERAMYASHDGLAHDAHPAAVDRLADVRRRIAKVLSWRVPDAPPAGPGQPQDDDRPNAGPMARLEPQPLTQPPAGTYAPTPTPTTAPAFSSNAPTVATRTPTPIAARQGTTPIATRARTTTAPTPTTATRTTTPPRPVDFDF